MITLTDSAIQELKRLRSKYEKEGSQPILRLGVKPSGCSGLSYVMNFESRANPDDHTFDFGDIQVAVDPLSMTLISGTTVDFSEDLLGAVSASGTPTQSPVVGVAPPLPLLRLLLSLVTKVSIAASHPPLGVNGWRALGWAAKGQTKSIPSGW